MTVAAIAELLGGTKASKGKTGRKIGTVADLVAITREGLPADVVQSLASELSMDRKAVAQAIGISERTLSRRLAAGARLSPVESDRTVRLVRVIALASETLGDIKRASQWLQTPSRVLKGLAPFDLLDTDAGVQSVETLLGRIAYGVYS